VKAETCRLFEIQINKLCWTDPCLYTSCITYISSKTGWITSKVKIDFCFDIQSKHKNTLCELNIEFFSVKPGTA
jgi:hypothetical protein